MPPKLSNLEKKWKIHDDRSQCAQDYSGEFELLFGVSSLDNPAE